MDNKDKMAGIQHAAERSVAVEKVSLLGSGIT
jgi:hypothetical protein